MSDRKSCRYCGGAGKFQIVSSVSDSAWATCFCSRANADIEAAARVAESPGFIEARDTDWDAGVNYAKRYIAAAIRALATPATSA